MKRKVKKSSRGHLYYRATETINNIHQTLQAITMLGLLTSLLTLGGALVAAAPSAIERRAPAAFSTFTHNTVYKPLQQAPLWRTAYARALQLQDKSLILTWEDYPYGEDASHLDTFKVLRSTDGGVSWANLSQVVDTQNGWGMRFRE